MSKNLQTLAERHAQDPSEANRDAVVRAALPYVRSLVSRINTPDHFLATREDLENIGFYGLLQALDGYDPSRKTPFVSYAYGRIRGAVIDYLRSIDALPRARRRRLAKAQQTVETLRQERGEEPSDQEVADALDISLLDYHQLLYDAQRRYAVSLHAPLAGETTQLTLETIPNEGAMEGFEQVDRASLHDFIGTLVKELPEREQNILALYYFENLRLRDIAQLMSLTEARISQILSKILLTLRTKLQQAREVVA
ncbi:MAG: sigma-70 family RNA polymerase sigma factor [Bacteroidetes bacterium]|nr:sigma-70 family RNA polymerase sigma factor [Bacteroidota bacterium]